ncbi:DUF1345 domain-containing protein [Microbacterium paraoxydans]|uniref:DUF1345 domain-containing protein n=1 Tax=Microbacterium paraoxydans TaxID=199592 RepID=UPI00352FEE25
MTGRRSGLFRWIATAAETCMFLASVAFLATVEVWALTAWLVIGTIYVAGGLAAIWGGKPVEAEEVLAAKAVSRWSWIPPVLAAAIGGVSAVTALLARNADPDAPGNLVLVVAASLLVILSWILLQVGFAQIYLITDALREEEDLRFPEGSTTSVLSYVYFAFTLGTSFATSDVEIISTRMRRLTLVHAVVAFFYNALVVAVAFQVLQGVVAR